MGDVYDESDDKPFNALDPKRNEDWDEPKKEQPSFKIRWRETRTFICSTIVTCNSVDTAIDLIDCGKLCPDVERLENVETVTIIACEELP